MDTQGRELLRLRYFNDEFLHLILLWFGSTIF